LKHTEELLERTRQPYHYLVQMVMQRDKEIKTQTDTTRALQSELEYVPFMSGLPESFLTPSAVRGTKN